MEQVRNPLKFHCAPNQATPDYVIYDDFRQFVAYGLMSCWLSHDENDPNADANMPRPIDREDVQELRGYFLNLLSTTVQALWNEAYLPGDGKIDGDWEVLYIANDEETCSLIWYVRLDENAMMFELSDGNDSECIWLSYEGIKDRSEVNKVLIDAYLTVCNPVREYEEHMRANCWYVNDLLHRTDGPAIEYDNGGKMWYRHGKRHRTDGPAIIFADGTEEYWIDGKELTKEEFQNT